MTDTTPLTSEAIQTLDDGVDRPSTTAASVSGVGRVHRSANRDPVDTREYRGTTGYGGSHARSGKSSRNTSGGSEFADYGDLNSNAGDQGGVAQNASSAPPPRAAPGYASPAPPPRERQGEGRPEGSGTRRESRQTFQTPLAPPPVHSNHGLTAEQEKLLAELVDINGQDSYDALAAGIGKLKKDEYLRLPRDFRGQNVHAREVGKPSAHANLSTSVWAQIYALNKAVAPDGADPVVFGFLRMEAVKAGWYIDQKEVTFVDGTNDAMRVMLTDFALIRDRLERIKTAAFIVPLVAEHVFRTLGHHYITTDSATYTARYADTFRSCLLPDLGNLLPPPVLYHAALHWVSPKRSREVLMAQREMKTIPDALKIRANAAPAGTAILTTSAAVIEAMSVNGIAAEFARAGKFDLDLIRSVTDVIKAAPTRYHKSYFAYGVNAPDPAETTTLEKAKAEAIKFAPYAQAFIDTLLKDAALGKAKALSKHADGNPIQKRRAATLFRALIRKEIDSVASLFDATISRRDLD